MAVLAQVREIRAIKLDDLVIGLGQVRVSNVGEGIEELAESIRKVGLLEPIVVCPAEQEGKYEILTGQRRFLAHQELQAETIMAVILEDRVDETTAKTISVTENMIRRDLTRRELIDACTALYKKYGSIKDVAEATGLPSGRVSEYVKYDRLIPELKQLVDDGLDIKAALRAQDAASTATVTPNAAEAVMLAKEMAPMSDAQRKKIVQNRQEEPDKPASDVIEDAKSGSKITQVNVVLGDNVHRALLAFARQEGSNLSDVAAMLIEDGLRGAGMVED